MATIYDYVETPIGILFIAMENGRVRRLTLGEQEWLEYSRTITDIARDTRQCHQAVLQLYEYFEGKRTVFTLPLAADGPVFHREVWQAVQEIPWGETRTYSAVAEQLGRPQACRAVGRANGLNPIPIFIPCHRVLGKNGSLTGFRGGLAMKQALLELEHPGRK